MTRLARLALLGTAVFTSGIGCATLTDSVSQLREPENIAEIEFNMARVQERSSDLPKAKELYLKMYGRHPNQAAVCHRLGVVHSRLGEFDAAMRYFEEARRLDANNGELLTDMGYALLLQNRPADAEAVLRQALAINPELNRAHTNLAVALGQQGRMDESFTQFRQVVPEAEAHANVAFLHVQRGEGTQAIEHYSRALTLDPNLKPAMQALAQLAEVRQRAADQPDDVQIAAPPSTPETVAKTTPAPAVIPIEAAVPAPPASRRGVARLSDFSSQGDVQQAGYEVPAP